MCLYKPLVVNHSLDKFGEILTSNNTNNPHFYSSLQKVDVLILPPKHKLDAKLIKSEKLKFIIGTSSGTDHILNRELLSRSNIKILNCPKSSSEAVAELTIAMIIILSRNIIQINNDMKNGTLKNAKEQGQEIFGKNLLVVGCGNIGKKVLNYAKSLKMNTEFIDSKTKEKQIQTKIKKADFISLHLPFTKSTRLFFDEKYINLMKKSAYLINTSRGEVVNEKALYKALKLKKIAGAYLDVFGEESPLNPSINKLPIPTNVITTPHIGYRTREFKDKMDSEIIEKLTYCKNLLKEDKNIKKV